MYACVSAQTLPRIFMCIQDIGICGDSDVFRSGFGETARIIERDFLNDGALRFFVFFSCFFFWCDSSAEAEALSCLESCYSTRSEAKELVPRGSELLSSVPCWHRARDVQPLWDGFRIKIHQNTQESHGPDLFEKSSPKCLRHTCSQSYAAKFTSMDRQ